MKGQMKGQKRMRYVEQKGSTDCGPCCVAMLINKPLRTVIRVIDRYEDGSTSAKQIKDALEIFGFSMSGRKTSGLRRTDFNKRDFNCLLRTKSRKSGSWHWMVWDTVKKHVKDPDDPSKHKKNEFPKNLESYYEVIEN